MFLILVLLISNFSYGEQIESQCYGTTANGRLKNGVKLPLSGKNFVSYSYIAIALGRTNVHSAVKKILVNSYQELLRKYPAKVFKYAETGLREGGRFKPHKTHQNGLSIDHMVPVTKDGKSTHLPTHPFNKLGYSIEFDKKGNFEGYKLDYEALSSLIVEIDIQTKKLGYRIWRVIFDPKMTPKLFRTSHAKYLKEKINFSKRRSWVRHDEHIHIDFEIPCK